VIFYNLVILIWVILFLNNFGRIAGGSKFTDEWSGNDVKNELKGVYRIVLKD